MTWHPPTDDAGWLEALGAYLDGELSGPERAALERHLQGDARHAAELARLRRMGAAMQAWSVETPTPAPAFLAQLEAERRPERRNERRSVFAGWPRWSHALAIYALGLFSGIASMMGWRPVAPAPSMPATPAGPAVVEAAGASRITPEQADFLLQEIHAAGLEDQCLAALRNGDGQAAVTLAAALSAKYPESRAMQSLRDNSDLRWAIRLQTVSKGNFR